MTLGKVVGTVVATQKDSGLAGFKLQIVQTLDLSAFELKESFFGRRRCCWCRRWRSRALL